MIEETDTRAEILQSAFVGTGLTACLAFAALLIISVAGLEHYPSFWWLILLAVLLSGSLFLTQASASAAHTDLQHLARRIGTRRFDAFALMLAIFSAFTCGLFARDWLPVPALAVVSLVCLNLLRQEPKVERGIPELYKPPIAPAPEPVQPSQPGQESTTDTSSERRDFQWEVQFSSEERASMQMHLSILVSRLQKFREKNPYRQTGQPRLPDFREFVKGGVTEETLEAAKQIRKYTDDNEWTAFHEVCAVLAFAQSIPYSLDTDSVQQQEYWRYPIETLYDQTGDCEDTSILAACILLALGHEVAMLDMPGHIAIGVAAGPGFPQTERLVQGLYYYCETTTEGWRVGQIPEGVDVSQITVTKI